LVFIVSGVIVRAGGEVKYIEVFADIWVSRFSDRVRSSADGGGCVWDAVAGVFDDGVSAWSDMCGVDVADYNIYKREVGVSGKEGR